MRQGAGAAAAAVAVWIGAAGCESGVTVDVTYRVPDEVAAGYGREAPGVLVTGPWSQDGGGPRVAVCGEAVEFVVFSDGFGCKPDGVDEEKLEAWVVPMPASWDPALCDAPAIEATPADTGVAAPPLDDLPAPTATDPYGSAVAAWRATPICGGTVTAEVVLAPR